MSPVRDVQVTRDAAFLMPLAAKVKEHIGRWKIAVLTSCHNLAKKVHDFFLTLYAQILESKPFEIVSKRLLTLFIMDKDSERKLQEAKANIAWDHNSAHYMETARFFGKYVTSYLKSALANAKTMPDELRMPWMRELLWETPEGKLAFTLKGKILETAVLENEELIQRYVELNVLKGCARFAEKIHKIQSDNEFVFLDLVKDLLGVADSHLMRLDQAKRHPEHAVVDEVPLAQQEEEAKTALIKKAMEIFLPNGIEDFELPIRASFQTRVADVLYSLLEQRVLPTLIEEGLLIAKTPRVKSMLIYQGLMLEKVNIEVESKPDIPGLRTDYPPTRLKELEEALHGTLYNGFSYAIPDQFSNFVTQVAPRTLASSGAETMAEVLPLISLQEVMRILMEKMLPCLDEGGRWEGKGSLIHFVSSDDFHFEHTLDQKLQNDRIREERTREELAKTALLAETAANDPKRIFQLVQSKVFRRNHAIFVPKEKEAPQNLLGTIFQPIVSSIVGVYDGFSKHASQWGVEKSGIPDLLTTVNTRMAKDLLDPKHERIFPLFANHVVKLLG